MTTVVEAFIGEDGQFVEHSDRIQVADGGWYPISLVAPRLGTERALALLALEEACERWEAEVPCVDEDEPDLITAALARCRETREEGKDESLFPLCTSCGFPASRTDIRCVNVGGHTVSLGGPMQNREGDRG